MKKTYGPIFWAGVLIALAAILAGCVGVPAEARTAADTRPAISFRIGNLTHQDARIYIDDVDKGRVGDYLEGLGALRVQPGERKLLVFLCPNALLEEKIQLAEGAARTIVLR